MALTPTIVILTKARPEPGEGSGSMNTAHPDAAPQMFIDAESSSARRVEDEAAAFLA
jgi:hypothetical protein